jgi:hypothetical protein
MQKPSDILAISSAAVASTPPPPVTIVKGGAGLTACNYDSVKSFAQQLLQYLESQKNMEQSYIDLDREQLRRDFLFDNVEERDALIDSVYDTSQNFVSQYGFSANNDPDDNGSPGGQS